MRDDVSNKLVHLTKGDSEQSNLHRTEAAVVLIKILTEKILIGGTGFIKGKHKCICFSEAPISKFSYLLAKNDIEQFQYQPYGIMVDKDWLFQKGGRPVIYGADADYKKLHVDMQYRHVRFELRQNEKYSVDHTADREWRINKESLSFTPEEVTIIVPDRVAKEEIAKAFPNDNWHFMVLSDLGVTISPL